jgi:hypothetical protein
MSAEQGRLPGDLVRGQQRFRVWRSRRKPGSRIPEPLWALAAQLASAHGVCRVAAELGLDYYSLKKRAEAAAGAATPAGGRDSAGRAVVGRRRRSAGGAKVGATFIELPPAAVMPGKHCLFELANAAGARMRVQLTGYEAAEVAAFSRSLWKAE